MKLLLLFFPLFLISQDFILSYRVAVKDSLLLNERFTISKSMTKENFYIDFECRILEIDELSLIELINLSKEEVLECLFKNGVKLKSYDNSFNFLNSSTSVLSIPPKRFNIENSDGFIIMRFAK